MDKDNTAIEDWITTVIATGSWRQYHDLHIDEVNPKYESSLHWVEGGLSVAKSVIDCLGSRRLTSFNVVLGFSLKSAHVPLGMNFRNFDEMLGQFDTTPPSVYIYEEGWEEFKKTFDLAKSIDPLGNVDAKFFYLEYKDNPQFEYRRSLLILYEL